MTVKILFNGEEVAEVYFQYINRHTDEEEQDARCELDYHIDLIHKTATQIIRSPRTPIWRGLATLAFYLDSDIFKYEDFDKNGKKIAAVIIPFVQVNSVQTWSRKVRKRDKKAYMQKLDATTIQDLR